VYRATSGVDAKLVANVDGSPRFLLTAPDGSILVTSTNAAVAPASRLSAFSSAGALKQTVALNDDPSDLALDSAGNAWLGSRQAAAVQYVSKVLTAPVYSQFALPSGSPENGVAVSATGSRTMSQSGYVSRFSTAGVLLGTTPCPPGARDLVVTNDGSLWLFSHTWIKMFRLPTDGAQPIDMFAPFEGTAGEVSILDSVKGVLLANGGRFFVRFPAGSNIGTRIDVPGVTAISGLAVDSAGRVWVADNANARMVIVTLP
jgi:hypothetical protein